MCHEEEHQNHVASPELLFGSSHLPQRASHASPRSCCPQHSPSMRPLTIRCFRTASASGSCTMEIDSSAGYARICLHLSDRCTGCSVSRPTVSRPPRIRSEVCLGSCCQTRWNRHVPTDQPMLPYCICVWNLHNRNHPVRRLCWDLPLPLRSPYRLLCIPIICQRVSKI